MRKTVLVVIGSLLVVAGGVMLVLPGPGLIVIAAGLAVLASAGVLWAARLLVRARERLPDPRPPTDDNAPTGLVNNAMTHLDTAMEELEAVEQVAEEDRLAREKRHREQLVTTDENARGPEAVQDLQADVLRHGSDHPNMR